MAWKQRGFSGPVPARRKQPTGKRHGISLIRAVNGSHAVESESSFPRKSTSQKGIAGPTHRTQGLESRLTAHLTQHRVQGWSLPC